MNGKTSQPRLLLSHGVAILGGLLLATLIHRSPATTDSSATSETSSPAADPSTNNPVGNITSRTALRALPGSAPRATNEDFRQAWDLLTMRPMPLVERYRIRGLMLTEWAEIDLDAALRFALEQNALSSGLETIFARHPLESWKFLATGAPGMKGDEFREDWLRTVIRRDRSLTLSLLDEMPSWMQDRAVPDLYGQSTDPDFRRQLLDRLRQLSEAPERLAHWMEQLAPPAPTEEN